MIPIRTKYRNSAFKEKKEQTEKLPPARAIILRQINGLEKEIDGLVYELYGLSEEEIAVVEGG